MANFISNLFSSGATNLVEAVGDAIDKNYTSTEEKKELDNELSKSEMQYNVDMANIGLSEQKANLQDTANAREASIKIQESANASWLSKNIHPFMALVVVFLTFFLFFWIIVVEQEALNSDMKEIIIYILGALTTLSTQVVAFYFGSSQGSKDKQKSISDWVNRGGGGGK